MAILELISRLVHHGRVFEEVYDRATVEGSVDRKAQSNFHGRLVDVYVQILQSLAYCHSEFQKSTPRRSASAIFKPDVPKNIMKGLEESWGILEGHARDNDRLQAAQLSEDIRRQLPDCLKIVSRILVKMDENSRAEILDKFSRVKFKSHHKSVHDQRTADTGNWLLQTSEFQEWQAAKTSTITLLYGSRTLATLASISRLC